MFGIINTYLLGTLNYNTFKNLFNICFVNTTYNLFNICFYSMTKVSPPILRMEEYFKSNTPRKLSIYRGNTM